MMLNQAALIALWLVTGRQADTGHSTYCASTAMCG